MVPVLVDRVAEAETVERILAAARDGLSGVLVLRGEAGIGKTALLDHLVENAGDMQVAQVTGVESEMDLGFAGLHQLLVPFLGGLDGLPVPQREALQSAFGLVAGLAPDRFMVGLATLTLITDAAVHRPVLCVIDDAQWLDKVSVEVLGFVARRLFADRVGMFFAVREGEQQAAALEGLSDLTVDALPEEAAGELLAETVGRPVDRRTGARIVAEAAGNPLALVEFAHELTEAELAGTAPLGGPLRFGGRLQGLYRSRVRALPEQAQMLLLVVAADQLGDPGKVWRAADQLGIDPEVAELPAVERLVTWAPRVGFRHPLMRSAAYYAAPAAARRRAHESPAAASDPERDPDRRAWHLAAAAAGPDEQIAAELERSADRARSRGGWASGAVFLERAAELTPDPGRRAQRLLEAAETRLVAGDAEVARALLERATPHLADPLAKAKVRRLEGLTLNAAGQLPEATSVLLDAVPMIEPFDTHLARDTLLEAFLTAQLSGQSEKATAGVLRAVQSAPKVTGTQATLADLLLDGFAAIGERRYDDGAALLRRAIAPMISAKALPEEALRHFMAVSLVESLLHDESAWDELEHRWVEELRSRGALAALVVALVSLANHQLSEGRFADAEVTVAEGRALSEATGYRGYLGILAIAELRGLAWRGQEADARAFAGQLLHEFTEQGNGRAAHLVHIALTPLELGLGNYEEALRGARESFASAAVLELSQIEAVIEAGVRSGDLETAAAALQAVTPLALASRTPVALGLLARGRALLGGDDQAESEYQQSIEHLRHSRGVPELARSRLLYGEWLRRQRRRRDAREELHAAWQMSDRLGMEAFAERARAELLATGEHARKRTTGTREVLTPQEAQIARLAGAGASNAEIAARLFISASTVEYHLRKVYRKTGVTGRVQLAQMLMEQNAAPVPDD
jgi:DNA-binding CsgD family transcriptional regulator